MGVTIHQIIAALKPNIFCSPVARREVKKMLREAWENSDESLFLAADERATPAEPNAIDIERLEELNPFSLPAFKSPIERHSLSYDSLDDSLEAFYFRVLDKLAAEGWAVTKIGDTFLASPGSGLFADVARRQSQAQREAMQLLRQAHFLVQDILRTAGASKQETSSGTLQSSEPGRIEVEGRLLRSKIQTLKLYARWLAPYLRQVRQLEQNARSEADAVSIFNTAVVEITLLAQKDYPVSEDVDKGVLPRMFLKRKHRACDSIVILELRMRAVPDQTSRGSYAYRGRVELTATSCALNHDEIKALLDQVERASLRDLLGAVTGDEAAALNEILKRVETLVTQPAKPPKVADDPNPFLALLGLADEPYENPDAHPNQTPVAPWNIKPDSDFEAIIRSQALLDARKRCLEVYAACKNLLNMPHF